MRQMRVLGNEALFYSIVITGRKAGEIKQIYMDLLGVRHGIAIVPIAVNHVVRGPMVVNTIVNLFYLVDSSCGVDSNSVPKNDESYLITGRSPCTLILMIYYLLFYFEYLYAFLGYQYKRRSAGARKGKEPFFVTACSDSMKLNSLTITQIGGVFSQLYCLRGYKPITVCEIPASITKSSFEMNYLYFSYLLLERPLQFPPFCGTLFQQVQDLFGH